MKHAASAIVILLISGIAFAAIHYVRTHSVEPQKAQTEDASNARQANSQFHSEVADPIHFDDVRLDSILTVVSAHCQTAKQPDSNSAVLLLKSTLMLTGSAE